MRNLLLSILKPKESYAKWLIFIVLVGVLVLGALGYFDLIKQYLDTEAMTFELGDYKISLYGLVKSILIITLIFWITTIVSNIADRRINKIKQIRSTNKALLLKTMHIAIYIIAFLITLDIVGLDLTALTVFGGALGIGIGFGLQKIASNFISGIILLLEKSVEEQDLVELADGTIGFIRKTSFRYTLVETIDGKEILVPNEEFISTRVINWTFSNHKGRIDINIGVSYSSDLDLVNRLILEAAQDHPRSLSDPEPKCFLRAFGDSSVDFVLHFWIDDIALAIWQPQSEVLFAIWRKFKANNIEIPFPQRDLHIMTSRPIEIKSDGE